jgi:hypothetical protein
VPGVRRMQLFRGTWHDRCTSHGRCMWRVVFRVCAARLVGSYGVSVPTAGRSSCGSRAKGTAGYSGYSQVSEGTQVLFKRSLGDLRRSESPAAAFACRRSYIAITGSRNVVAGLALRTVRAVHGTTRRYHGVLQPVAPPGCGRRGRPTAETGPYIAGILHATPPALCLMPSDAHPATHAHARAHIHVHSGKGEGR